MVAPTPDPKKEELLRVQRESQKIIEEDEAKRMKSSERRQGEHGSFATRGQEEIAQEKQRQTQRKIDEQRWLKEEKAKAEAIEADREKRQRGEKMGEEQRIKEEKFTKEKAAYLASLHGDAARKAQIEKKALEWKFQKENLLAQAAHHARDVHTQAERDEARQKEDIERESLREKDHIDHESSERLREIQAEETKKKSQVEEQKRRELAALELQRGQSGFEEASSQVERDAKRRVLEIEKIVSQERGNLAIETREQKKRIEQEALKKKSEAERRKHVRHEEIERDLSGEKQRIMKDAKPPP